MDVALRPRGHFLFAFSCARPGKFNGTFLARMMLPHRTFTLNWIPEYHGWWRGGSDRFAWYDMGSIRLYVGNYR